MGAQLKTLNANLIFLIQKVVVATSPDHKFVWDHLLATHDVSWRGQRFSNTFDVGCGAPIHEKVPGPVAERAHLPFVPW